MITDSINITIWTKTKTFIKTNSWTMITEECFVLKQLNAKHLINQLQHVKLFNFVNNLIIQVNSNFMFDKNRQVFDK